LSEEVLQIAEERSARQGKKGKICPTECRIPEIARRDKKSFLNKQCKEIEENNRMGKSRDLFKKEILSRKSEISREHFIQG